MKKLPLFTGLILGLLILTGGLLLLHRLEPPPTVSAATTTLTGSLQAACYLDTRTTCKISVAPYSITIAPGEHLLAFNLKANDNLLYDFGASTARPVIGTYTPTTVALDYAAQCGQTYTLKLHAIDSGDLDFVTIGETQPITCPNATFLNYVPFVER